MRIHIDNLGYKDGLVTVHALFPGAAKVAKEQFQEIMGITWAGEEDFAFSLIPDEPDLVNKLQSEGYDVDATNYSRGE